MTILLLIGVVAFLLWWVSDKRRREDFSIRIALLVEAIKKGLGK